MPASDAASSLRRAPAGDPARATRHSGSSRNGSVSNSPRLGVGGELADRDVERALPQRGGEHVARIDQHEHLEAGAPEPDLLQRGGNKARNGAGHRPDPQLALGAGRERGDLVARFGQVGQHAARIANHRLAVGGGLHPPGEAIEERHAEGVLQLLEHSRRRGLRHGDVLRRLAQAAVLGDGDEERELPRLEPRAQVPVGGNCSLHWSRR